MGKSLAECFAGGLIDVESLLTGASAGEVLLVTP